MLTIANALDEIVLTPSAKAAAQAAGADLPALLENAKTHLVGLRHLLTEALRLHPRTGADAAGYEAIEAVWARLV